MTRLSRYAKKKIYQAAFEAFARVYPHEAAELDWPRFRTYSKTVNPALTDAAIRRMLKETAGEK